KDGQIGSVVHHRLAMPEAIVFVGEEGEAFRVLIRDAYESHGCGGRWRDGRNEWSVEFEQLRSAVDYLYDLPDLVRSGVDANEIPRPQEGPEHRARRALNVIRSDTRRGRGGEELRSSGR